MHVLADTQQVSGFVSAVDWVIAVGIILTPGILIGKFLANRGKRGAE